jgi:hypothetical protein
LQEIEHTQWANIYASAWSQTDREICTGLAPEIPEDLYMLIKKVIFHPNHFNLEEMDAGY